MYNMIPQHFINTMVNCDLYIAYDFSLQALRSKEIVTNVHRQCLDVETKEEVIK